MFNKIVFIGKLILGLLPIVWGIFVWLFEKKDKCENLANGLTISIFGIGLWFCFYKTIDVIFYLLGW
jgi:hypothetical protein